MQYSTNDAPAAILTTHTVALVARSLDRPGEPVQLLQGDAHADPGEQALTQHRPELAHHGGSDGPVAHDVAHDEENVPVRAVEHVEPVAAGVGVLRSDEVVRREVETGDHRQGVGQQRGLDRPHAGQRVGVAPLGEVLRLLGAQPPLDGLGHVRRGHQHSLDRAVGAVPGLVAEVDLEHDLAAVPVVVTNRHSRASPGRPVR